MARHAAAQIHGWELGSLGSWDNSQARSPDSNETFCVLNHRRRLALQRLTAAPTVTQLRVCLTLSLSVATGETVVAILDPDFVFLKPLTLVGKPGE